LQHTVYKEEIEERENAGTPPIIQTIRASLAFWVKEYVGYQVIENKEQAYIHRALQRLLPNKNIWILGNTTTKRQAILSFLIYSTTNSTLAGPKNNSRETREALNMWGESGKKRDKPLHGPLVASLLNDLFGIQARGGCACAGPYGHALLDVDDTYFLAFRDAVAKVKYSLNSCFEALKTHPVKILSKIFFTFFDRGMSEQNQDGLESAFPTTCRRRSSSLF
jgi:selenocysteine lyase/cysteine desulfurase